MQRQISILVEEEVLRQFDSIHGRGRRSTVIENLIAQSLEQKKAPAKKKVKPPAKPDDSVDSLLS